MRDLVVKEYGAIEGGKQTLAKLEQYPEKVPVIVERTYSASINDVWKAITDIDQKKQWYMPALHAFEPKVGFETGFSVEHEGNKFPHVWKVTEVVPGKKIAYTGDFLVIPASRWPRLSCFLKVKTRGSSSRITAWKRRMAVTIPLWPARTSTGAGTNWERAGTIPASEHHFCGWKQAVMRKKNKKSAGPPTFLRRAAQPEALSRLAGRAGVEVDDLAAQLFRRPLFFGRLKICRNVKLNQFRHHILLAGDPALPGSVRQEPPQKSEFT
jgi:hypothetical protein